MIGYTQRNNDIYLFLENNEIDKLEQESIEGIYLNVGHPDKKGILKMSVNKKIGFNKMIISINKNTKGVIKLLNLEIGILKYKEVKKMGALEEHEGFRHVCIRDVNRLDFYDEIKYSQLKSWAKSNFVIQ